MVVIGHQLVRVQLDLMDLQRLMQDDFERRVIRFFVEDGGAKISTIQSVLESAGSASKRPDPNAAWLRAKPLQVVDFGLR